MRNKKRTQPGNGRADARSKTQKITAFFAAAAILFGLITVPIQAETEKPKVTAADYTEKELDSSRYEVEKYATPFWEGNIVYNECVYPIKNADGSLSPFSLMYRADEIVSVRNYGLDIVYEEGVDYRLTDDGRLEILPNGGIHLISYNYMHPSSNPSNKPVDVYYPRRDGQGYEYWNEGPEFSQNTIVVTYIHNDTWQYSRPESLETQLPKTMSKLIHREPMKMVILGDSITWGAKGSGCLNISPYADAYPEMTVNAFGEKFGCTDITFHNSNVGGSCADDFTENDLNQYVIRYSPDFLIICFGMNDASSGRSADTYMQAMEKQVSYIRNRLPECEILLLTSPYGNPYTFPASRYEEHARKLHEIADRWQGVAVADAQTIEKDLLQKKDFLCFMGDNMVHPNDFGMRLLCQTILSGFSVTDFAAYRAAVIADLEKNALAAAGQDEYKTEGIRALIKATEETIATLDSEWEITDAVNRAYADLTAMESWCAADQHSFVSETTPPTCTDEGYTEYTCQVCGYSRRDDILPALGGEHLLDSGRQVQSPTYQAAGRIEKTCLRCGEVFSEVIPSLENPPAGTGSILHVNYGYNYMQTNSKFAYTNGTGTVELDVCPLDISQPETVPYIGVWFADYTIAAVYNFRTQCFEILQNNLPLTESGTVYASKAYPWMPDSGENIRNWKKFAVQLDDDTVRIYLNGELMLSDSNPVYRTKTNVALVYSTGEYFLDNIRIGAENYNPATGEGNVKYQWNLDSTEERNTFNRNWDYGSYTAISFIKTDESNVSTACYPHDHHGPQIGETEATCTTGSRKEYQCEICKTVYQGEEESEPLANGHILTDKTCSVAATDQTDGEWTYRCLFCDKTFTQRIPAGTDYAGTLLFGDVNSDGELDAKDGVMLARVLAKYQIQIDSVAADLDQDGDINAKDAVMLQRILAKWKIALSYSVRPKEN